MYRHYFALVCGGLLISALLMGNIAANRGLVDQRSFSVSLKPVPENAK